MRGMRAGERLGEERAAPPMASTVLGRPSQVPTQTPETTAGQLTPQSGGGGVGPPRLPPPPPAAPSPGEPNRPDFSLPAQAARPAPVGGGATSASLPTTGIRTFQGPVNQFANVKMDMPEMAAPGDGAMAAAGPVAAAIAMAVQVAKSYGAATVAT